jgi:hypothetical protein
VCVTHAGINTVLIIFVKNMSHITMQKILSARMSVTIGVVSIIAKLLASKKLFSGKINKNDPCNERRLSYRGRTISSQSTFFPS